MKIDDDHQFHGAALMQIAEDPHFTAINAVTIDGETARSAFRVNADIGVYLKYATKPVSRYREYRFTFTAEQLEFLRKLEAVTGRVFLALVCIKGREICCLPYETFLDFVSRRRREKDADEDQYVIPVTLPSGKGFRAYINSPGSKGKILGKAVVISRSDFPRRLFAGGPDV